MKRKMKNANPLEIQNLKRERNDVCYGCDQYKEGIGCKVFSHSEEYCKELTSCNYMKEFMEERIENKSW